MSDTEDASTAPALRLETDASPIFRPTNRKDQQTADHANSESRGNQKDHQKTFSHLNRTNGRESEDMPTAVHCAETIISFPENVIAHIPVLPASNGERTNLGFHAPDALPSSPRVSLVSTMVPLDFVEKLMDWQTQNMQVAQNVIGTSSANSSSPQNAKIKQKLSQELCDLPDELQEQLVIMKVQNLDDVKLLMEHPEDLADLPLLHRRKLEHLLSNSTETQPPNPQKSSQVYRNSQQPVIRSEESDSDNDDNNRKNVDDQSVCHRKQPKTKRHRKSGTGRAAQEETQADPAKTKTTVHQVKPLESEKVRQRADDCEVNGNDHNKRSTSPKVKNIHNPQTIRNDKKRDEKKNNDKEKVKTTKDGKHASLSNSHGISNVKGRDKGKEGTSNKSTGEKSLPSNNETKSDDFAMTKSKNQKGGSAISSSSDSDSETSAHSSFTKEKKPSSKRAAAVKRKNGNRKNEEKPKISIWKRCCKWKKASSIDDDDLKKDLDMDDHIIELEELLYRLGADAENGLSGSEAKKRLEEDGKNVLAPAKQKPEILKFLSEILGGFSPLLLVGSLLAFVAWGIEILYNSEDAPFDNMYLGIVLLAVVLISGTFLYLQKRKSEKIMESFKDMLPQHANVIRDGELQEIPAEDVVLGDLIEMKGGDRIPADVRVVQAEGLKVDNSSLTGESEAQIRSPDGKENPLESENLCFFTTNAVEGVGRGIVIRRGEETVLGRIARLTMDTGATETTIAKEIRAFVKLISILSVLTGILCCIIPLALGFNWVETVILAIGIIVANVPEGVFIAVTVMLTLTAKRMAKKNCLVKNLEAIETLGSCSIICSDKTGTLTQNKMTVADCWVDDKLIEIDMKTHGDELPESHTLEDLIRVATLCNHAEFTEEAEKAKAGKSKSRRMSKQEVTGDASETALLKFVEAVRGESKELRGENQVVVDIPFNSTTKFQVSVHLGEDEGQERYLLVMKGAPEQIWERCAVILSGGEEQPIDETWSEKFAAANLQFGQRGERVLGFCDLWLPLDQFPVPTEFDAEKQNFPLEGLRFIGLIAMIDPPRIPVPDAVKRCHRAGIRIIMVTGDQPVTAEAIARSVGIISEEHGVVNESNPDFDKIESDEHDSGESIVIHGQEQLKNMTEKQIEAVIRNYKQVVFARTSPQQKLIIVEACQKLGAVVAVTGDGVNDAPALKISDIGIAMGITGSDVSKQAADIILLDDNFATIVTGIEEGRLTFDNLKKTICYTLMTNIPEIAPVLLYIILDIPLALTVIPMLLICLATDMIPSISLAYEPCEGDIMTFPPRKMDDRLVSGRLIHCAFLQAGAIAAAGAFFSYFFVFGQCGFRPWLLLGLRAGWHNRYLDDLKDSHGQEWNYAQRMNLQHTINTAYFVAIVLFQWFDLICRKVRRKSVFQQGMRNWFLNAALILETGFAAFLIYTPEVNRALSLRPIMFLWWWPALPFAVLFFLFDELRRFLIRRKPGGFMEKEFYF